jgi:hypothetical protein
MQVSKGIDIQIGRCEVVGIKTASSGKKYIPFLNYSHPEMEASTDYVRVKYAYFA